jgi:hypothetical protein
MEEKEIIERDRVGNKEKDSKDGTNSLALVVHIKNPRNPHHNFRPPPPPPPRTPPRCTTPR